MSVMERAERKTGAPARAQKAEPRLAAMELIRQSRLSVSPVRPEEWHLVAAMAEASAG